MIKHHPAPLAQLRDVNPGHWRRLFEREDGQNPGTTAEVQAQAAEQLGAPVLADQIRQDGLGPWFAGRPWPDLTGGRGMQRVTAAVTFDVSGDLPRNVIDTIVSIALDKITEAEVPDPDQAFSDVPVHTELVAHTLTVTPAQQPQTVPGDTADPQRPMDGWRHPDHLPGVDITTWVAHGPDSADDGALVVQVDTHGEPDPHVRVRLNDAVLFDGHPDSSTQGATPGQVA